MGKFVKTENSFNLAEALWAKMEAGLAPWQITWGVGEAPGKPQNVVSQKAYRGGNSFYLMMHAASNGWSHNWLTFNQAKQAGGTLKGQKGTHIETPLIRKVEDEKSGDEKEILLGFRSAVVFNSNQVEGVDFIQGKPYKVDDAASTILSMLDGLKSQGFNLVESEVYEGCWYEPGEDKGGIPAIDTFAGPYEYYSALAHVLARSTMVNDRVVRENRGMAYEMVRSEMAATLICSSLGLPRTQAQVDNNAAFMSQWLTEFSEQKSMLLKAASEASAIHDYLMDLAVAFEQQKAA